MKKIILILIVISSLFTACDTGSETQEVSKVTIYPTIEVLGDNPIFVPQGGTFTDPGATALEGVNTIPFTTSAEGNYRGETTLNTNISDEYSVTYTATNTDGFKASAVRKVIVYKTGDLVTSIEGVYKCSVKRNTSNPVTAQNIRYVYIWKNTDGNYEMSDVFGGWYQYHRGFGIGYITPGGIINAVDIPTNNFTFPGNPQTNTGFGGIVNITGVTVNATTKTVVVSSTWSTPPPVTNYTFEATLTQQQL